MDERQAFLDAIAAGPWDDELTRGVFADWLDEHGEHDEADRQRKHVQSERWLREFAAKHQSDFWGVMDESDENHEENIYSNYGSLMYFLKRHVDGDFYLPFDTPYDFTDYSEELWQHFEIVTCLPAPQNEYRHELPPFRCSC